MRPWQGLYPVCDGQARANLISVGQRANPDALPQSSPKDKVECLFCLAKRPAARGGYDSAIPPSQPQRGVAVLLYMAIQLERLLLMTTPLRFSRTVPLPI